MGRKKTEESSSEKHQRARYAVVLRAARTALGLSQRELGIIVGIHYSSLARFENGQVRLKPTHIETILQFLVGSGLHIEISTESGIHIKIPHHVIDGMLAFEGLKMSLELNSSPAITGR